jgi:pSer/pThr/pTyr-binding forkhead associated (FHA) protein
METQSNPRVAIRGRHQVVLSVGEATAVLTPEGRVRIGRHSANDLVIDSGSVSRFHAEIRWAGDGRAIVADQSSQNGTFVDEAQVHGTAVLQEGSKLRIAGHKIAFRFEDPEQPAILSEDEAGTKVSIFTQAESSRRGRYETRKHLQTLLLDLEEEAITGVLQVTDDSSEGSLVFANGVIVAARSESLSGLDALERVLHTRSGRYTFSTEFEPIDGQINVSISQYLKTGYWSTLAKTRRWRPARPGAQSQAEAPRELDGFLHGAKELRALLARIERERRTGALWLRMGGVTFVLTISLGRATTLHRNAKRTDITLDEVFSRANSGGKFLLTREPFQAVEGPGVTFSHLLSQVQP